MLIAKSPEKFHFREDYLKQQTTIVKLGGTGLVAEKFVN